MIMQKISFALILLIISCSQPTTLSENEKTAIIGEIRQTFNNYYGDIRKSGLTAEFKYLDSSAEFFWVPPGYGGPISYDSVVTVLRQNAPKFRIVDNTLDTLRIIPLSRELATYTGRLHSSMTDTSGKTMTFSMLETGIVIRRKDGWKLLSGQTSIINP